MNREELDQFLQGIDIVEETKSWLVSSTGTYEGAIRTVSIFLNSDPADIDFDKEYIVFYEPRENRYGTGNLALFTATADEVIALIESGDIA